jgi:hypothetical protein
MTSSVTCPEDILNLALARIGYKGRINSIYEGSMAAKKALDIYAQTRDAVLREGQWGFAQNTVAMTLQKQAPAGGYFPPNNWTSAYPQPGFLFQYAYPPDCLEVRAVRPGPLYTPNFSPQPNQFDVTFDGTLDPPAKCITCNVYPALLVYTAQVTDPSQYEADFVEALAAALARRLAPLLSDQNEQRAEATDEQASDMLAERRVG